MRIYTRTGDAGQTSLADGTRVPKSQPRVALYGDIDELNSVLGCCLAALPGDEGKTVQTLRASLGDIQRQLFALGMVVADPRLCGDPDYGKSHPLPVRSLEVLIDSLEKGLPPLRNFILPAGSQAAAFLHLARTVCRRCERKAVALAEDEAVPAEAVMFLNRLSDFLFVAARAANAAAGLSDVTWSLDDKGE